MQTIKLGNGCTKGNSIHEIGHALGLWHKQSREDRGKFIDIKLNNIKHGKQSNFKQHISDGDDLGLYDYGSLMHYGTTAFAIDKNKPTIVPKSTSRINIGQRTALSAGDISAI